MAYTPTQGLFVNGRVADADEVLNEFGAISVAISETETEIVNKTNEVAQGAKDYTDDELATLVVDGGTF